MYLLLGSLPSGDLFCPLPIAQFLFDLILLFSLEACLISNERPKGAGWEQSWGSGETWRKRGRGTIIKIYCDVKKAIFNKKGGGKTDARNEKRVGSHGAGKEMAPKH